MNLRKWAETRRCCCHHPNAWRCSEIRGGDPQDEPCECHCHDRDEDEDDEPVSIAVAAAESLKRIIESRNTPP